jgi:hypothetical protein
MAPFRRGFDSQGMLGVSSAMTVLCSHYLEVQEGMLGGRAQYRCIYAIYSTVPYLTISMRFIDLDYIVWRRCF